MISRIDGRLIQNLDDWQVLLALKQEGFSGLITLDYMMLQLPKEMAVLHQTKMALVAIEAAAHNPLRAIGQLLTHAPQIAKAYQLNQAQIFRIPNPRAIQPMGAWNRLGEMASEQGVSIKQLFGQTRLSPNELATPVLP